jgi:glycosyltransferase involved in cell wall biosynthesis
MANRWPAAALTAPRGLTPSGPAALDVESTEIVRPSAASPLNIVHVLRAPLGGLFRHVVDLAEGQAARGHRVGLIVDSTTGGSRALAALAPRLAPHGGSLVYRPRTIAGGFYRTLEWVLKWRTDLFLFESTYIANLFRAEIGRPPGIVRVVHNGVGEAEFAPVVPRGDATDIISLGELRPVKAFDVLIEALAILKRQGRPLSVTIAGDGPDAAKLKALAVSLGIADLVRLVGFRPAREAFAMGRMMVIPSRAESLPYVILEAAAAGVPIISTRVGGIPEIFGPQSDQLIAPDDIGALIGAINRALDFPAGLEQATRSVQARVRAEFSLSAMVDCGLAAYREALALRKLAQFA